MKVWEKINLNVVVDGFTYYLGGNAEYKKSYSFDVLGKVAPFIVISL